MDIGNSGIKNRNGFYVREVVACDHVGINYLVMAGTRNFFIAKSGYLVFEEDLCKVVCPECLLKGSSLKQHST